MISGGRSPQENKIIKQSTIHILFISFLIEKGPLTGNQPDVKQTKMFMKKNDMTGASVHENKANMTANI